MQICVGQCRHPHLEEITISFTLLTTLQRFVRVYLLKDRTEVAEYFHEIIARIDRNARHETRRVHTDIAGEFVAMRKGLAKMGIELPTSTAYNPQSNGLAKRTKGLLMSQTRVMLKGAGAEKWIWREADLSAAYL